MIFEIFMEKSLLSGDKWIGFQLKEGPCSAGCSYCYERPTALNLLKQAVREGKIGDIDLSMNNAQLAFFISKNKDKLGLEFDAKEIEKYFDLLKQVGINRTFFVGSEPTEHSDFSRILDSALKKEIQVLVYTSGTSLQKLNHPAVKFIVLHLSNKIPSGNYMKEINSLIERGKEIHFRVNFSSAEMKEKNLVFSFFSQIKPEFREKVLLKYSFTSKVSGTDLNHFTPSLLKKTVPKIVSFVEEFNKSFPLVKMYSERLLFPCSFPSQVWEKYKDAGGFTSKCEMEFVVYPNSGLVLCPPARNLLKGEKITSAERLRKKIFELKKQFEEISKKPSFDVCKNCEHRINSACQGGCGCYKE